MHKWMESFRNIGRNEVYKFISEYIVPFECVDGRIHVRFKIVQTLDGTYYCFTSHFFKPVGKHPYWPGKITGVTEEEALLCGHNKVTFSIEGTPTMDQFVLEPEYNEY